MMFERPRVGTPPLPARSRLADMGFPMMFPDSFDLDAYLSELRRKGVGIHRPIGDRPYGLRDFGVLDPDGYYLVVAIATRRQH